MKKICIGIPCFSGVAPEVLEDYMRFAFHLGRRNREYDFLLAIKAKSEQFRARNAIVEAAFQVGCTHLFFLDDDHIIDWKGRQGANQDYDIVRKLLKHEKPIVGALYYQRGGSCRPVLMKRGKDGGYYFLRDDEITGGLQRVDVQGGGCMLIDMKVFEEVPSPWFEPELQLGTDIQICEKARKAGFEVWCDTSIVVGHLKQEREIITPYNRTKNLAEMAQREGIREDWRDEAWTFLYREDAEEFSGKTLKEFEAIALEHGKFLKENPIKPSKEYYRNLGFRHFARTVIFNCLPEIIDEKTQFLKLFLPNRVGRGLDYYCGSAPIGFELAMRGHEVDFFDIDGVYSYEFVKWRAKKRGVKAGFSLRDSYDYILLLDAIEHMDPEKCEEELRDLISRLKEGGMILMNYFENQDYANPEHTNMDKERVKKILVSLGVYPITTQVWIKHSLGGEKWQERESYTEH